MWSQEHGFRESSLGWELRGFVFFFLTDFCVEIIGGNQVTPHSRPYMVLLKGKKVCAGALVAKDWVLTAAHCVL